MSGRSGQVSLRHIILMLLFFRIVAFLQVCLRARAA